MPNSNTNEFNLNDDQIERLAEAIVEKLFIKQEEADCYICYGLKIWALFWLIVVASWGVGSLVMQLL